VWPGERGAGVGVLYISLGARHVEAAVCVRGAWLPDSLVSLPVDRVHGIARPLGALIQTVTQLGAALEQGRGSGAAAAAREVRVLVADTWLAVASLPWSSTLRSAAPAEAYARGQLLAAGYELGAHDLIRFDDAGYGEPRLAVAYPGALMEALRAVAAGQGAVLRSTLALSVTGWMQAQHAGVRVLGLLDDGLALVVHGGRRIGEVHARSQRVGDESPTNALKTLWQRLRMRDPAHASVERLPTLDFRSVAEDVESELLPLALPSRADGTSVPGSLQLARLSAERVLALDAVSSGAPMRPWHWLVAAATAALAGVMLLQAGQAVALSEMARTELTAVARVPEPAPKGAVWSREELARAQAVNLAVRELNTPISALLAALQPPRDVHTAVLSVELGARARSDTGASTLRVIAEAQGAADMTRYVAYLADRGPLEGAYLLRHEIAEDVPGHPYRFTVEAAWKD